MYISLDRTKVFKVNPEEMGAWKRFLYNKTHCAKSLVAFAPGITKYWQLANNVVPAVALLATFIV